MNSIKQETRLNGVPISMGACSGPIFFFTQQESIKKEVRRITPSQVKGEIKRFLHSLRQSRDDIERLKSELEREN
ncbi:MAG: phosphoenolpyruvate-utilizing N-terminal domain-containing protein, partial [Parachlamydiaceae bacterium]